MTTTDRTTGPTAASGQVPRPGRLLAASGGILTAVAALAALGAAAVVGGHRFEPGGATLTFPVTGELAQVDGGVSEVRISWVDLTESEAARLVTAHVLDVAWVPALLALVSVLLASTAVSGRLRRFPWAAVLAVGAGQVVASVAAAAVRADVLPTVGARLVPTEPAEGGAVPYLRLEVERAGSLAENLSTAGVVAGLAVVIASLALSHLRTPARPHREPSSDPGARPRTHVPPS